MQNVCPITDKRINEQVARLNGVVTVLLVILFILFDFWPGMLFLSIDFMLRGFFDSRLSPICQFNIVLARQLNLTEKMMNAGPKIFAAQVGMLLSGVALATFALNCGTICLVIAGMLGFFSFLESAFGFCVACKLYPFIRRN
jgi:predicted membrane protein